MWLEQSEQGGEREGGQRGNGTRSCRSTRPEIKEKGHRPARIMETVTNVHFSFPAHSVAEAVGWPLICFPL